MADHSICDVDLAVVDLDSPFFTGRTGVLVMEDLAYDVVVGRIPGSKPSNELNSKSVNKDNKVSFGCNTTIST